MINSPFKFLDAYGKPDKEIFFGRDKDIELLYETTFKTSLLLVYGQSGTGKTSLIQCGLANRFREADWFDLYIRRRDNINDSLHRKVREKAKTPINENTTISEAIQSIYLDYLKPIYLIFDQFEELFILGTRQEQQEFFQTIAQLLKGSEGGNQKRASCKIIFVMREEYIAWLYDFEKMVPELCDHRIRVEPMNPTNVETVIHESARAFDIRIDSPDETVKHIIDNNKDQKGIIHLPYLQVYLDRLYREAAGARSTGSGEAVVFTPGLVEESGKISDVMAAFLDEQSRQIQQRLNAMYPEAPKDQLWQVLTRFVTVEGTNSPMTKEALYTKLSQSEKVIGFCLTQLESARILHVSEQDKTYEIAHDALARCINEKRSAEEKTLLKIEKLVKDLFAAYKDTAAVLTKRELNYIEPYEEELKSRLDAEESLFIAKSRKKVSLRRIFFFILVAVVTIIIALITAFTFSSWSRMHEQEMALEYYKHELIKTKTSLEDSDLKAKNNKELYEMLLKEKKAIQVQNLAFKALSQVTKDPTIALGFAKEAWLKPHGKENKEVVEAIYRIYSEYVFYEIIKKLKEPIKAAAFSPDGQYILTGSKDNTACLWDRQGNLVMEYKVKDSNNNDKKGVNSVAFSPDGKYILTGSEDATARLWELENKKEPVLFNGHKGPVTSVAFSPNINGEYILTGSKDNTTCLWDRQGKLVKEYKVKNSNNEDKKGVNSVAFSPDGKYILTGLNDATARLWELENKKEPVVFSGHTDPVSSVAFSPDGETILTGSLDGTAILWNPEGKKLKDFEGRGSWVNSVAFSPNGNYILIGAGNGTARLLDREGKPVHELKGHTDVISSVVFSPDGKTLLTGSKDKSLRLWDWQRDLVQVFNGHTDIVRSVAFSPDGNYILTGSADQTARLWDRQGNLVQVFNGHTGIVGSAAFSPDGNYILTGSADQTARLWDRQGNLVQVFNGHTGIVGSVAFSPDGNYILTGSADQTARLWDLEGKLVRSFNQEHKVHKSGINSVAFSPDGKYILTGSADQTAWIWDVTNGKEIKAFKGHSGFINSAAFSPDGNYILTGSADNTARLWDLQGNQLQVFKEHDHVVSSVAFSPDGETLLTGSRDQTARVWNRQGNQLQVFKGHNKFISSVAFSPDGKNILIGSGDKTARLWKITTLEEFLKKEDFQQLSKE